MTFFGSLRTTVAESAKPQPFFSHLEDKGRWPYAKDVEHFDALPVRATSLFFCGLACGRRDFLALWKRLNPDPTDPEIIRNYPIRQPLLWV